MQVTELSKPDKETPPIDPPERSFINRSSIHLIVRVGLTVSFCEAFVVTVTYWLLDLPAGIQIALDAVLMILLLSPVLYLAVIRPMALRISEQKHSEEMLKRHGNHLEELVHQRTEDLSDANETLKQQIKVRTAAENLMQERTFELDDYIRELQCLYAISRLMEKPNISIEELVSKTIGLIPFAWLTPETIGVRLTLNGQEYLSDNFQAGQRQQTGKITVAGRCVGLLEVVFLEEFPDANTDTKPKREKNLIEAIAERLGGIIARIEVEKALQISKNELEHRVEKRTAEIALANETLKAEINERRLVEKKLHENKTMLQAVFDGIADPLVLVDSNMVIKMINRAASEYYGTTDDKNAIGRICWEATQKSGLCDDSDIPSEVLNNQVLSYERKGFMAQDRLERVFIYPVKEQEKGIGNAIIHITDITEARRMEKQLVQSEKMASLGVLVTSIAHEINNPNSFVAFNLPILEDYIEAIIPFADEYAAKHPDLELFNMSYPEFRADIIKLLKNIAHGSERISSFVSNLREFAQFDGRKPKEWVDLKSVINRVLSICGSNIKKKVKSFNLRIPDDFPAVYTDPNVLEQVLLNLIVNASQAVDKKSSWIRLSAASGDNWRDHTIIEISDNGCGMDEETKRHIFNPFFTTKAPADGTGLGLYVCHNLIEGIGGYIEVESEPDRGSTFRIILPDKDYRKEPR